MFDRPGPCWSRKWTAVAGEGGSSMFISLDHHNTLRVLQKFKLRSLIFLSKCNFYFKVTHHLPANG